MPSTTENTQAVTPDSSESSAMNIKSRIFWRITAGMFVSILLIEIILLVFSWFNERERIITRLDETMTTVISSLDKSNPVPQLLNLLENQTTDTKHKISGFRYVSASGEETVGGESKGIVDPVSTSKTAVYDSSSRAFFKLVTLNADAQQQQNLWVRVDAGWVAEYMQKYVARIVAMVLLISVFVTIACLFFLRPILLNPLLRLDRLLVRSQNHGLENAIAEQQDLHRKDELGSVFRSFSLLRNQLLDAKVSNAEVTDRFEQMANLGADCFWELDSENTFSYVAGDTKKIFNLLPEQIMGQKFDHFVSALSSRISDSDSIFSSITRDGFWEGKIFPKAGCKGVPVAVNVSSTPRRNAEGQVTGYRGTIKNVTKEVQLSEELTFQASHDELTRLYNRRELRNRLQIALDRFKSEGSVFSLLILDLDHFKTVNDTSGHMAGDALLKTVSDKLVRLVGEEDVVARMGGDEFAIIFDSQEIEAARDVAEHIRNTIEELQFVWNKNAYSLSASMGLVEVSEALNTSENITNAADICCMQAKKSGRNQVCTYSSNEESELLLKNESLWITKIKESLDTDKFSLFRQLIVPIDKDNNEEHFEILVRMQDPDGGYYTPDKFLPVAERNDLMPKIDQWVADNSLLWLERQNMDSDRNFCMNINLSAASLSDHNFREYIRARVASTRKVNHFVCFEVTESAAMTNYQETVSFLNDLKKEGCAIALDDFGTGFSSLSHIRTLPLDYIKIDGVFIKEIVTNQLDQAVVSSVVSIAKVLGIKTVAEFVDSNEAVQKLADLEIDYAQGYLFSKPEPLQDMQAEGLSKVA